MLLVFHGIFIKILNFYLNFLPNHFHSTPKFWWMKNVRKLLKLTSNSFGGRHKGGKEIFLHEQLLQIPQYKKKWIKSLFCSFRQLWGNVKKFSLNPLFISAFKSERKLWSLLCDKWIVQISEEMGAVEERRGEGRERWCWKNEKKITIDIIGTQLFAQHPLSSLPLVPGRGVGFLLIGHWGKFKKNANYFKRQI